jgi:hypothetical protein
VLCEACIILHHTFAEMNSGPPARGCAILSYRLFRLILSGLGRSIVCQFLLTACLLTATATGATWRLSKIPSTKVVRLHTTFDVPSRGSISESAWHIYIEYGISEKRDSHHHHHYYSWLGGGYRRVWGVNCSSNYGLI